jgi:hypothetical protein
MRDLRLTGAPKRFDRAEMEIRIAPAGAIRMLVWAELTAVAAHRLYHIGDADELTPRCAFFPTISLRATEPHAES